jgi:hypothetical protein
MVIVMLEIGTVAGSSDSESDWAQQEPASPLARCSARGASLSHPWDKAASLRLSSHWHVVVLRAPNRKVG